MNEDLQAYWTSALATLLTELETTPNVSAAKLATWKQQFLDWQAKAETTGATIDAATAIGLYTRGRNLMPTDYKPPPAIATTDAAVQTSVSIAAATAGTVAGVAIVVGLVVYAFTRR